MSIRKSYSVADIQHLSERTYRIILQCDQGYVPEYFAGQYLLIHLANNESSAFSIANPPVPDQQILELHIQKVSDSQNSIELFRQLELGALEASVANGQCHLKSIPDKPLLFVAAGTGFAQMKSMIEYCQNINHPHDIHLYWGARSPGDYYLPSLPVQWSTAGIHYHPVVSESSPNEEWNGRYGLLYDAIISDKAHLNSCEIYISGSPTMVYATVDAIASEGFNEKNMHSDVFEYAPRE